MMATLARGFSPFEQILVKLHYFNNFKVEINQTSSKPPPKTGVIIYRDINNLPYSKGNPSKLSFICINFDPPKMGPIYIITAGFDGAKLPNQHRLCQRFYWAIRAANIVFWCPRCRPARPCMVGMLGRSFAERLWMLGNCCVFQVFVQPSENGGKCLRLCCRQSL